MLSIFLEVDDNWQVPLLQNEKSGSSDDGDHQLPSRQFSTKSFVDDKKENHLCNLVCVQINSVTIVEISTL